MTLKISSSLSLPDDAALWTFADLAIKGAGKTYAASVLAEEMMKAGVPIVAIDCMGIWWGLRVGVDGKAGLPIVIFGGEHADIPIPTKVDKKTQYPQADEERLQLLVKSILQAGISAVLDTSQFSKKMQRRIAAVFISELYRLNKDYGVRHVFLEEADTLAPQRLSGELNFTFGAVDDLVRRGGNFNLGCTLITQRSAVLNKDVLTQCNCLIALRVFHKIDKNAVKSWVEEASGEDAKKLAKWYDSLKDLQNGEAWVWHPPDQMKRIQFRKRETLHPTREYFRQQQWEQKNVKLMDVDEFVSKFKKVFETKKAEIPKPIVTTTLMDVQEPEKAKFIVSEYEKPVQQTKILEIPKDVHSLDVPQTRTVFGIPQELLNQEPRSMLGKVCVILKNGHRSSRNDRWSVSVIRQYLKEHAWDDAGVEDAIDYLIREEILVLLSNGMMRFYPDRVEVKQNKRVVEIA
ncbi:MAG: ATP-binding protein [Nitrososphaerales archaeon]